MRWWRIWLGISGLAAALAAGGCASRGLRSEGDVATRAEAALAAGRPAEGRALLEEQPVLSVAELVLLGDCRLAAGDAGGAERAYFDARARPDLEPASACRASLGLGEVALRRSDGWSATARFADALERARSERERCRAIVGQARAELLLGHRGGARALRTLVTLDGVAGLAELDAALARERPAAVSPPANRAERRPRPAPATGRRRTAATAPAILRRSRWRARSPKRSDMLPMGRVTRITVHHTADRRPVKGTSARRVGSRIRSYQGYHMNGRGWADIGYHYVIDPQGRIWEGREERWQGAHAGNGRANRHNLGIALIGNFERRPVPREQRAALKALVTWLVKEHRIRPEALHTHREMKEHFPGVKGTACPGRYLNDYFRRLRAEIRRTVVRHVPRAVPGGGVVSGAASAGGCPCGACGAGAPGSTVALAEPALRSP